jgi:hypothetical protein
MAAQRDAVAVRLRSLIRHMADQVTEDFREAMIDWIELTHNEVRSIRRMVQFVLTLWILLAAAGVIASIVAVNNNN